MFRLCRNESSPDDLSHVIMKHVQAELETLNETDFNLGFDLDLDIAFDDVAMLCTCLHCDTNVTITLANYDVSNDTVVTWDVIHTGDEKVHACKCEYEVATTTDVITETYEGQKVPNMMD